MALALKDRVKETTIVVGTGAATLLGSSIGFQPFSVVGNGNTTYYCISDQFGSNWEVGIGTYSSSGNTLARTTVLASSNAGALVVFTAGVKDVFVTYPAEKGVWLDASNNAIGLGTPAAFVGTNITGTASGLTAGNVTTNANLSGAVSSIGNSTSLGSFTSAQLALAISDETGTGKAVFATNPTLTSPTYAGTLTGSTDILNIGSGQLYKDASGNVGIGTSSPSSRLDIQGNAAGQFWASIKNTNAGASSIGGWIFGNDTYSDVGGVFAGSSGGGGFGGANSMNIGSWKSAPLAMFTNNTERMRIDSSGNVGIGTSSPSSRLTVVNTTDNSVPLAVVGSTSLIKDYGPSINFQYYSGSGQILANIKGAWDATGSGGFGNLIFSTRRSEVLTEAMRIDASGNLLVGTTNNANPSSGFAFNPTLSSQFEIGHASGTGSGNGYTFYMYNQNIIGSITQNGTTGVLYNLTSDYRLKNNPTALTSASDFIMALQPKTWDWWDGSGKGVGFIAHEFMKVAKYSGTGTKDEVDAEGKPVMQSIQPSSSEVMANLVSFVQELKAIIDTQQEQINSLLGK